LLRLGWGGVGGLWEAHCVVVVVWLWLCGCGCVVVVVL
jgi:hypothetical protein